MWSRKVMLCMYVDYLVRIVVSGCLVGRNDLGNRYEITMDLQSTEIVVMKSDVMYVCQ